MSRAAGSDDATEVFARQRGRLQAVAYRMLGRFGDAEDVVQDTWLRWRTVEHGAIADPEAYLVRITTRLAMDRLRSAQARRESYVGSWLPEPILTDPDVADQVSMADSVSSALLLVLESLSPLERAVFVLHEAFGFAYTEVARLLDSTDAAVRQTARRARQHVEAHRPSYDTDVRTREEATAAFLQATAGGDLGALLRVLAPDVTLVSDGGGLAPAPRRAISGPEVVAKALVLFASRTGPQDTAELVHLNGGPGIAVYSAGVPVAALSLHLVDGVVRTIHLVSNPEKLAGMVRPDPIL